MQSLRAVVRSLEECGRDAVFSIRGKCSSFSLTVIWFKAIRVTRAPFHVCVYILQRAHPPADIGVLCARVRTLLTDRVHPLYAQLHVLFAGGDARSVGTYFKYVYWTPT